MAASSLEVVAKVALGREPLPERIAQLLQHFQNLGRPEREEALTVLAVTLAERETTREFLRGLVGQSQTAARTLALEIAAHLPLPLERGLLPILRPLLLDRSLPTILQMTVVVALLSTTDKRGPVAVDLIAAFVTGLSSNQVQTRLQALEQRVGAIPALAAIHDRLQAKRTQRCPHCDQPLPRAELAAHLWERHGLLLSGPQARPPWVVLEDWLTEAVAQDDPDRLARCFELAQHLDAEYGLARLERLLRVYGLEPEEADYENAVSGTCPHCTANLEGPASLAPLRLHLWRSGLAAGGYRVHISERGLLCHLTVEAADGLVFRGCEPGQRWTLRAVFLALVGLPLLTALALAMMRTDLPVIVALLLGHSLMAYLWLRWWESSAPPALDRAIDHAWILLAPRLHPQGFMKTDSAFLAGLATVSVGRGQPLIRERVLERLLETTEQAAAAHVRLVPHLACLWRLAVEDGASLGRDPATMLARVLTRCLEGSLPLALADQLLHGWQSEMMRPGTLARLRALVCQHVFENGFEVADLRAACELAPALGTVLGNKAAEELAHLWLLWSLRTSRPWESCGEAFTVFELAGPGRPGAASLERYPDLLLYQFLPGASQNNSHPTAILVCSRGVIFRDQELKQPMTADEIMKRLKSGAAFARHIERWLHFYSKVILSRTASVLARPTTGVVNRWQTTSRQICPHCGQQVLLPRRA